MQLVEQHIIKRNSSFYKEVDSLSFLSKNLYNKMNYIIRRDYLKKLKKHNIKFTSKYLNFFSISNEIKNLPEFKVLPSKVSQQILILLDKNWKSFAKATKEYYKNASKFNSKPKLPKYKDKVKGRNILIYNSQTLSKTSFRKEKIIHLSKTNIKIKSKIPFESINQVRIIPKNKYYTIEIVYSVKEKELLKDNKSYGAIDLGVNNLATVSFNNKNLKPFIINGKPLKSINQFYNKKKSNIQSTLEKVNKTKISKSLVKLSNKRNNKIKDYLHRASKHIISFLIKHQVNTLVVGKNKNWKQDVNLGAKNNQNFIQIPHSKFINMLKYKCELNGINFILTEESYTSKCSFLDLEDMKFSENYKGQRIKRGLFKSSKGILINADLNGSLNILRKVFSKVFKTKGIEDFVVNPLIVNL